MVHEICIESVILPSPTPAPSSTPKSQDEKKKRRPSPTPATPSSTPKSQDEKKKRRPEQRTLMTVLNEVIKEEDQNLRRVRGEIRRSSASSLQQQAAKENMGKGDSSLEEQKGQGESRTSSSTSGSRVLKDSNLVLAKAQLSRPTMKKMSNNGVPQKEYKLYPFRSQSLSRRTRRGSRR